MAAKPKTIDDEVEAAQLALSAARGRLSELAGQKAAIETALAIHAGRMSHEHGDDDADVVRARREAGLAIVRSGRRPTRLQADLEDLTDAIIEARTAVSEAKDAYDAARSRATTQLARDLQPRHREIVSEIAALLDELGRLSVEEVEIRQQVATMSGDHPLIPRAAIDVLGLSTDWNSPLSQWFRRMRERGLLGDSNDREAA